MLVEQARNPTGKPSPNLRNPDFRKSPIRPVNPSLQTGDPERDPPSRTKEGSEPNKGRLGKERYRASGAQGKEEEGRKTWTHASTFLRSDMA